MSVRTARIPPPRRCARLAWLALLWALLAATPVLIDSCGKGGGQEVVFWQFWPVGVIQPLLDEFQKQNPTITRNRVDGAYSPSR